MHLGFWKILKGGERMLFKGKGVGHLKDFYKKLGNLRED